jgi:hypothetical protein
MNQRIRELYLQAVEYSNSQMTFGDTREFFAEKFAQLLVLDCASVNYNSPFQDGEFHAREVLEHFGVEE